MKSVLRNVIRPVIGKSSGSSTVISPTSLSQVTYNNTKVDLSWTNGETYDGIYVYISFDNITFYLRDTIAFGTAYRVTGLIENTNVYFKIAGYKGSNSSTDSNTVTANTGLWYLSGGVSAANCLSAFDFKAPVSLKNAIVNLKSPGTLDLVEPVSPPTLDTTEGLYFNNSTWLRTGVIPVNNNYTIIVKVKNVDVGATTTCIIGGYHVPNILAIQNPCISTPNFVQYNNGGSLGINGTYTDNVFAVAGNLGYRDGIVEAGTIPGGTVCDVELYLGALNNNGLAIQKWKGNVIALAIYNSVLTDVQILAITNRMNVLDRDGVWVEKGVVISPTLLGEENDVLEPFVMYEGNAQILTGNVFKMWYTGGGTSGATAASLFYAESTDGLLWSKNAAALITDHRCCYVLKVSGVYYIYTTGGDFKTIDLYTSPDGINLTLDTADILPLGGAGTWDSTLLGNTFVFIEGGVWYMFYDGYKTTATWLTGVATSNNGRVWVKHGGNPVIGGLGCKGSIYIIKINGIYYGWIHGVTSGLLPSDVSRYRSTDLYTWTLDTPKYTLERATADEGVDTVIGQVADVSLVEVNNKVYIFHDASKDGNINSFFIKLHLANMPLSKLILTIEGDIL